MEDITDDDHITCRCKRSLSKCPWGLASNTPRKDAAATPCPSFMVAIATCAAPVGMWRVCRGPREALTCMEGRSGLLLITDGTQKGNQAFVSPRAHETRDTSNRTPQQTTSQIGEGEKKAIGLER